MSKQKFCSSCGKRIDTNSICPCQGGNHRNNYQKEYYKANKDILKPLSSARWKKLRSLIIQRDHGYCQRCFYKFDFINSSELQVHHIKPRIKHPELMFEESNLITLCKRCNLQLGLNGLDFKPNNKLEENDFDFKL